MTFRPTIARTAELSIAVIMVAAIAPLVFAQGAAISTNLPPSVRSSGMGFASAAVFWGGDPDYWANPALLGYHDGIRYEHGRTQFVPDLADDVYFTTKRITIGAYGLGFAFSDEPFDGFGSTRLSYGFSTATSSTGEDLGTFESYEDIKSWGFGLSLGRAVESIWGGSDKAAPGITRYADVAIGMNWKHVHVVLTPDLPGLPGFGQGSGDATDQGLFVRLTPYDSFGGIRRIASLDSAVALRLDGSFGISTLNDNRPPVPFGLGTSHMMQESRTGWAAHIAAHPKALTRHLEEKNLAWLDQTLSPILSFGAAWDQVTERYDSYDYLTSTEFVRESDIEHRGWELGLLNILTIRKGHVSDPDGNVDGPSDGWSAGLTYRGFAGFRYDEATIPQATDPDTGERLSDVHRKAWTVFLDPVAASRRLF